MVGLEARLEGCSLTRAHCPCACRWHENGLFDLPATIDYILAVTRQRSLLYFGHSMGANILFVLLSERPEYNAKVRAAFAAAPAVYFYHLRGAFRELNKRLRFIRVPYTARNVAKGTYAQRVRHLVIEGSSKVQSFEREASEHTSI